MTIPSPGWRWLCRAVRAPSVWLLGSSPQSAIWAGELGSPYAFADFINPGGAEIAARYRECFEPSPPAGRAVYGGGRLGPVRGLGRGGSYLASSSRMTMTCCDEGS